MALAIDRKLFEQIYKGTSVADYADLFYSEPSSDTELLETYLPSKLWRLNNLYTIVDKFGNRVRFRMNVSQHKVYAASLRHPRLIILKSRQQGISTLWLVSFFDDTVTRRDFSTGLMAQGQDEASTLLERTKILWDELDPAVKAYLGVSISKDNTKEFSLTNGSNIFIRTSFRSTTLQRLHISEMGKIANKYPEKAQETKTGTLQAIAPGNIAVIESTAEGANLFKDMWDNAVRHFGQLSKKDFYPVFLSWLDDPDCTIEAPQTPSDKQAAYFRELEQQGHRLTQGQRNFWVVQHRELGDKIYQEYPSTPIEAFMATKDGAYYARLYLERVKGKQERADLYDPNLDVQVAVDLGMNDTMVLGPHQTYEGSVRIIDEIYDSGQPISYYCDILRRKSYFGNVTRVILPHDANVRDLTSGQTRAEVFELELPGVEIVVLERSDLNEGIENVRRMIPSLWIDPNKCPYVVSCLYNYRKQWDEKHNRWRDKPDHDEYSNGADMVRYIAVGTDRDSKIRAQHRGRARPRGIDV